ncbi:MAG: phage terminase large subunit family protein [Pseudomonadota bacterium]
MADLAEIKSAALAALRPPEKLALSDWTEKHLHLPSSIAATPGRMRLWPHQRAIADSMGDPDVERVSVLKGVRIGYTQLLTSAIGHYVVNDPSPTLVVLPTDGDARNLMTGNIEPTFAESPTLRAALATDHGGRDTMLTRRFPGGSLKLVSAGAPRNLRGHTARVLLLDEVDGFEVDSGGEGDPVNLAERRTLSYGDRKIIMGSTPVDEATSRVLRAYEQSDQRVYEVPCPCCGTLSEITWDRIEWKPDQAETAAWRCPHCDDLIEERLKGRMVTDGAWRATRPDVSGHHGYKVNCLVSLLPNASWGVLASEFLEAKKSSETLKAWTTTILAQPWRDLGDELDQGTLASRAEPFGLDVIPPEVLVITAGLDVQDDRVEMSTVGWTAEGDALVLAHEIVWGSYLESDTWAEVDDLLKRTWRHANGGLLRVDAAIVDSGSGGHTDRVYKFCSARAGRRIFPGKGVAGFQKPGIELSKSRKINRLILVGVDTIKSEIMNRLQQGRTIRFSETLTPTYYEQLTGERRVVQYRRGAPTRQFERIPGRRVETLDCLVYAMAARQLPRIDMTRRSRDLASPILPARKPRVASSKWMNGFS